MSWRWIWTPVLLAALAGCGGEPSVASRSAAAFEQAQKEGKTFEGAGHEHGHGGDAGDGGHGGHEMPEAAPAAPAEHQHGEMEQEGGHAAGHHAPAQPQEGHGHAGHSPQPAAQGHEGHEGHEGHQAPAPAAPPPAAEEDQGHDHAGHPVSPVSPASPASAPLPELPAEPGSILQQDSLDAPAETSVVDAQRSEEMNRSMAGHGHGTASYKHVDAGRGPEAHEGSHQHEPGADGQSAAVYACPMHPEVTSDKPGTCPKCGMALVQKREGE